MPNLPQLPNYGLVQYSALIRHDTFHCDPDLCRNTTKYTYNHKYKDAVEITLHFINIKELKFAYRQNGNKTS